MKSGDPQTCAQTWTVNRKCKKGKIGKPERNKREQKAKRQQRRQERKEKKKEKKAEKKRQKQNRKQSKNKSKSKSSQKRILAHTSLFIVQQQYVSGGPF